MPSGIWASIEPSEYSEYAMPSTTPDLSTVTGGWTSLRAAGGGWSGSVADSANVEGVRPLRLGSGASDVFERSGFGQASSNDAGGASANGRTGGAAAAAG